jgi:hypothetical protein
MSYFIPKWAKGVGYTREYNVVWNIYADTNGGRLPRISFIKWSRNIPGVVNVAIDGLESDGITFKSEQHYLAFILKCGT